MTWVVDASVAIKWFVEEDLTEVASDLLCSTTPLCAPDLLLPEVANIVWKKVIRNELTPEHADSIANSIALSPVRLVPGFLLHRRALQMALILNQSAYDCFYVACAEHMAGVLVTADQKLYAVTRRGGFEAIVSSLRELTR